MRRCSKTLLLVVVLGVFGSILTACGPKATPTPAPTPTSVPTPTPIIRTQVVAFLKAITAIDQDKGAWSKDFDTFIQYSAGMTYSARQTKYAELLANFDVLKQRVFNVQRPPADKARATHDAYAEVMSIEAQLLALLQPTLGQGMQLDTTTYTQLQRLVDQESLATKRYSEAKADLMTQFNITPTEIGQK
jgi:hypothetical protein